ncbi:MAG: hypothetical protein LBV34_20585 [Nocardiopsaceae bacterium]|nr:hypothetical protein [Nocardiopsaceae bacterium]
MAAAAVLGCIAALSPGCGVISGTGGQVVSYQGYRGTAIVSKDGRTITVGEFGSASCGATVRAVARESASRVALLVRSSTPRQTPSFCKYGVAPVITTSQNSRLHTPLGSRTLVDGRTGRATAWISARLVLRPTRVPLGYRLANRIIPAADLTRAQSAGPAGCTQFYRSPKKSNELAIIQTAGKLPRSVTPQVIGGHPIRVRGHAGRASRNVITWREDGLTDYILIFGDQSPQDLPQLLTTQQLIGIAESAPQAGD